MIKSFKKIRQKLLIENKFNKYLVYAIGEIILVVIGILIALQIKTWNENRKVAIEEQNALHNIQRDFMKNKEILEDVKRKSLRIVNAGIEILNHTGIKNKLDTENEFNVLLNELYNNTSNRYN